MSEPSFRLFPPTRIRKFGPWNVLMLITSGVIIVMSATFVSELRRPFRFDDTAMFALAMCNMAQAAEPAWDRDHPVARTLRIVAIATFIWGLAGAIYITWFV